MKLIIGLGNPGPKYETTRHNVGFLAIDRLQERWSAAGPLKKFNGEIFQARFKNQTVLLAKPLTMMNLSGKCVQQIFQFYQLKPEDLVVLHDDLDLALHTFRIKKGGGTGGHNGLKSLEDSLGKDQNGFYRIRFGISHPKSLGLKISPVDYVLQPFSDLELNKLDELFNQAARAVELILEGNVSQAMTQFNIRPKDEPKDEEEN